MLWTGVEEAAAMHSVIGRAGTLEFSLDLFPHLFAASDTHNTLPRPWEDSIPNLYTKKLQTA